MMYFFVIKHVSNQLLVEDTNQKEQVSLFKKVWYFQSQFEHGLLLMPLTKPECKD